jgi:hypothetical protein
MPADWFAITAALALASAKPQAAPVDKEAPPPLELLELLGGADADHVRSDIPWTIDETMTPEPPSEQRRSQPETPPKGGR